MDRRWRCKIFGHDLPDKAVPVYTNLGGKWKDERGMEISYHARICRRCDARIPATEEDATEKAKITGRIAAIMNGTRAQYGLPPISWDD